MPVSIILLPFLITLSYFLVTTSNLVWCWYLIMGEDWQISFGEVIL